MNESPPFFFSCNPKPIGKKSEPLRSKEKLVASEYLGIENNNPRYGECQNGNLQPFHRSDLLCRMQLGYN